MNGNHVDFILSFPFKRHDLFLSKWLFGALFILGLTTVNLGLMLLVHVTTLHGHYSTFEPFLTFFLFMPFALLAIYSLALMFGTITGKMSIQGAFTIVACFFPVGIINLITNPLWWHVQTVQLANRIRDLHDFAAEISLHSIGNPRFFIFQTRISDDVHIHYTLTPSLTSYYVLLLYIGVSFLLGLYLYKNLPSEYLGRVILHKRLEPIWLWGTAFCMGILGTNLLTSVFWVPPLNGQLIGFFIFSAVTYLVLSRFTLKRVSLKSRGNNQQVI